MQRSLYYDMGLQAIRNSVQLLTEFDKKHERWSKEIGDQAIL
ncbi:MAG: hypothetical protein ACEQSE_12115 [Candidatus Aquirickettsiella gammari]